MKQMKEEIFQLDRNAFSVTTLHEQDNDVEYWKTKTPEERMLAVEFLRQLTYNYDPATERLQRVFEFAEFKTN
jgi:hypothetical protein